MIKFSHVHENGKVCLETRSCHRLIEGRMLEISGNVFALAYMPYTGQYYVYNPQTGQEVASISKEFYESIKYLVIGTLDEDPTCKPIHN